MATQPQDKPAPFEVGAVLPEARRHEPPTAVQQDGSDAHDLEEPSDNIEELGEQGRRGDVGEGDESLRGTANATVAA